MYLLPIVCFEVSNDSDFALGESILITFYEARICLELNLSDRKKKKQKIAIKKTDSLSLLPPFKTVSDHIPLNMRFLSSVFVFHENIID